MRGGGFAAPRCASAAACGCCVAIFDQLLAEAAASANPPDSGAGEDGEGWRDAEAFWGGA
jgi:hypothetical protein